MKHNLPLSRRSFLASASLLTAAGGCRALGLAGAAPQLRFGVISDIHITTPESTATFEQALIYFRDRGADAVVVCGDLTDWGLVSSARLVADTWH